MISILIVHYNTPGLLRQTLKGFRRCPPTVPFEIVLVDNNPSMRVAGWVKTEFPEVKLLVSEYNRGFGGAMNFAQEHAQGEYVLVFNPDIAVFSGFLEGLQSFMETHPEVGIVGPQLRNADGSIQHSCSRFMTPSLIVYRRAPFMRFIRRAREAVAEYLMDEVDHTHIQEVDYMIGASLFIRRSVFVSLGGFDPKLFMYFEDQDLCRRAWAAGHRVVYYPRVHLIHYHRRETARGHIFRQLLHPLTRIQIRSAWYYFRKHKGAKNPRLAMVAGKYE